MGSQFHLLRLSHSPGVRASPGRGPWVAYAAVTAAAVVAAGLSLILFPRLLASPLAPFVIAVVLAAWLGGLGPSLVATALSIGAVLLLPYSEGAFTAPASRLTVFGI